MSTVAQSDSSSESARTDLSGKVAVVTGASRGIGRAIALRLGQAGASVVVNCAANAEAAAEVVRSIEAAGSRAMAFQADVAHPDEIEDLFAEATSRFGRIDIVVANAGIDEIGPSFLDVTEDDFDRINGVNSKGAFFTMQSAARHLTDGGSIVAIGSSTTAQPMPGFGLYGASKLTSGYLVATLAQELSARAITVNAVVPTATDDAGYSAVAPHDDPIRAAVPTAYTIGSRMSSPNDVADAVEYFVGPR